ncbi:-GPI mannosyltransferase 2 [Babesia bigemina]|uniref:GPI mannosyltransferase 2 n=1 Tax=Babesia bigemina TaxID=5866 RepID=A0A061DA34_BABBI|nr:-GPI mannosyltransferase 2 [Babesia bigemina]CDR97581.1 -GPI mannosyltransferase 2 [Babesia bigemina]|eukprot:XP_012769767.1 -GPI mannosyltransferase 2 [Babesia bigemina]
MGCDDAAKWKPRGLAKSIGVACFIKGAFCIYISLVSWHSAMQRPYVDRRTTHITADGYLAGRQSLDGEDKTCTVTERLSYKVNTDLPYSELTCLLDDRKPDGSLNENFYDGIQFALWKQLLPYLSWDSEHMLNIALDDLVYARENSAAFFPLLPWLVNITGKALKSLHLQYALLSGYDIEVVEAPLALYMALGGVLLCNLAGIIAAGALYLLVWDIMYRRVLLLTCGKNVPQIMTDDKTPVYMTEKYVERIAQVSVLFYCLGPATVHCTAIYTENLFCLCTFVGLLLLSYAENNRKIATNANECVLPPLIKAYVLEVMAVLLFFMASALRSNGVLLLIPLFFYTLRTCCVFSKLNLLYDYDKSSLGYNIDVSRVRNKSLLAIRFVSHWLRALIYAVSLLVPMATFQFYIYCLYCRHLTAEQVQRVKSFPSFVTLLVSPGGMTYLRKIIESTNTYARPWCSAKLPRPYAFVQKQYWDVGFLWLLRQPARLHVFLYCWPSYVVTYFALRWYWCFIKSTYDRVSQSAFMRNLGKFSPFILEGIKNISALLNVSYIGGILIIVQTVLF